MTLEILVLFFVFAFGASVGSFLNVLIYRLPLEKSIAFPASHCPSCEAPLKYYHNIPIFSWLFLKGKCAFCGVRISPRYIAIELINALFWLFAILWFGLTLKFLIVILLFSTMLAIFVIDVDYQIIPHSLNITILVLGLGSTWFLNDGALGFAKSGIGIVTGAGLFIITGYIGKFLFKREALGGGDVKMLGALGSLIGLTGVLETIFISALLAVATFIFLKIFKLFNSEERILPYGPFIAIAAMISFMFNSPFISKYIDMLQFSQETLSFISKYL